MYTQGIYPVGVYNKSIDMLTFEEEYEFLSETPFQDLMRDIKPVERVSFTGTSK